MRDIAAVLAMFATWATVCLIATVRPEVDAVTAIAAAVALAVTCALTPKGSRP